MNGRKSYAMRPIRITPRQACFSAATALAAFTTLGSTARYPWTLVQTASSPSPLVRSSAVQLPALPETYVPAPERGSEGVYFNAESAVAREAVASSKALSSWQHWYSPPDWLKNGDLMTLAGAALRSSEPLDFARHMIDTPDGGQLALDVLQHHAAEVQSRPAVILLSGLGGGSERGNVRSMAAALSQCGFIAGILNMRGMGGVAVRTPRFFSARRGSTDDVRTAVRFIRERLLGSTLDLEQKVFVLGWSNGGTIALNTLAEQETQEGMGHAGPLTAVNGGGALGAPYSLERTSEFFESGRPWQQLYNRVLVQTLLKQVDKQLHLFEDRPVPRWPSMMVEEGDLVSIDVAKLRQVQKLIEFDEVLTRRVFGFKSVQDYYTNASPLQRLHHVQVPTLLVTAADDPVVTGWAPFSEVRESSNLVLAQTSYGGHLGWLDKEDVSKSLWLEKAVSDFFFHAANKL